MKLSLSLCIPIGHPLTSIAYLFKAHRINLKKRNATKDIPFFNQSKKGDPLQSRLVILVYRVLQSLTSFELSLFTSRNFDSGAGARIATCGSSSLRNGKSTKTDQTNFITFLQSRCDRRNKSIQSLSRISLGKASRASNARNQFIFIHGEDSL